MPPHSAPKKRTSTIVALARTGLGVIRYRIEHAMWDLFKKIF